MQDYRVNSNNLEQFIEHLKADLANGELIVSTQPQGFGGWDMTKLWRVWMKITFEFLKGQNARMPVDIDEPSGRWVSSRSLTLQDTHELFTLAWLGRDLNGKRLTWSKEDKKGLRSATKGERLFCMQQHEMWALNNGINLFKPRGSELAKLEKYTNNG